MVLPVAALSSNYAFNPIAEQALGPNQTIVPQRVNAALGFLSCSIDVAREPSSVPRRNLVPVKESVPAGFGLTLETRFVKCN